MDKIAFKEMYRKCAICPEDNYPLLDVHRIFEGKEYSFGNCVVLCVKCHRLHHTNQLKIKEKRHSTAGYVLFWEKNGKEEITLL